MPRAHDELPTVRREPKSGTHVAVTLGPTTDHNLWADLTMDVVKGGGVFVATYHRLGLGTVVELLLIVEGEEKPIAARGVVRWTRAHGEGEGGHAGVGIRLLDVDEGTAEKLERFALSREPMMFDLEEAPLRPRSNPKLVGT